MRTLGLRGFACSSIGGSTHRAGFLGGLIGVTLILIATLTSSSAGTESGGIYSLRGTVSTVGNRYFAPRQLIGAHTMSYTGYGLGAARNYRGPLVNGPGWRSNRDNGASNPASRKAQIMAQGSTLEKAQNQFVAAQPFSSGNQAVQPKSTNLPAGVRLRTPSPAERSEATANINHRFQQAEEKTAKQPWLSQQRRGRLEQCRAFFIGLIDTGYPLPLLDTWCDDLLDDQVDVGMPVDLVDSYWGQPVSTQEYEEYYTPYEVCAYQTPDGNYRQVTFQNGVVTQAM
jgi:hypothetical protein